MTTPFQKASEWIDAENAQDPNIEIDQNTEYPRNYYILTECTSD